MDLQMENEQSELKPKLCLTVKEMAIELGIGMNNAYQLVNSDGFPVVRLGERKIRIPRAALEEWLMRQAGRNTSKEGYL